MRSRSRDDGLTLIEVCLAMLVLSTAALGCAQLFSTSLSMIVAARLQTSAALLASQKVEQLRSLEWGFLDTGALQPVTDATTDLSTDPMTGGGAGLSPSPASTLSLNTAGYVDFLDAHGRWVGTGSTPPGAAVFIRRWNVARLPASTNDALVLQVLVTTVVRESQARSFPSRRRLAGDAMVVTVISRKVR